jgi:hypothetical protein
VNILHKLGGAPQQFMMSLSESSSGIINKIGIASLTTGGTNAIVTTALETQNETWLSISDTVAIVSIVGSIVFIIKLSADFYYARRKDKREQELHDRQMK